ncbi:MAG: exosortase/archaeosortase family protein [Myxococcota bacterium]
MAAEVNAATSERRFAVMGIALAGVLAVMTFAPILYHMVLHWKLVPDYSHGFLVAPLAVYFAWVQKRKLRRAPVQPSWWGLLPLALGLLALIVGRLGVELMSMRVGFVLTLHGLVLLLLGLPMYRILAFPLGFLFLMVPLPQSLVNLIAFPLQLGAADLAVSVLHSLDFPVLREGNIIHLPKSQLFVAEACSGLRSLMALGTLGVVLAYFFQKNWVDRVIIVASTIPIAVVINAFRVGLTSILTLRYGMEMAEGVIHQTEGFFTFGLAFALLLAESRLLDIVRQRMSARGKSSENPA